jgi:spore coat polysaccharide biosynthesis protein SpsF
MTDAPLDREHVSLHIRNHPDIFPHVHLVAPPELHWPELGLTLDEPADYVLLTRILEHFGAEHPLFSCLDTVRLLRARPDWTDINQAVKRKGDS